eukprot:2495425-Heterocapsa_arctica.AAC.1
MGLSVPEHMVPTDRNPPADKYRRKLPSKAAGVFLTHSARNATKRAWPSSAKLEAAPEEARAAPSVVVHEGLNGVHLGNNM